MFVLVVVYNSTKMSTVVKLNSSEFLELFGNLFENCPQIAESVLSDKIQKDGRIHLNSIDELYDAFLGNLDNLPTKCTFIKFT